jgi:hypothetical protein
MIISIMLSTYKITKMKIAHGRFVLARLFPWWQPNHQPAEEDSRDRLNGVWPETFLWSAQCMWGVQGSSPRRVSVPAGAPQAQSADHSSRPHGAPSQAALPTREQWRARKVGVLTCQEAGAQAKFWGLTRPRRPQFARVDSKGYQLAATGAGGSIGGTRQHPKGSSLGLYGLGLRRDVRFSNP